MQVVPPEEAGAGFEEVGALESAKLALREAVQLPLQHPHLFAKGSLARPCKGVLLFGPPGMPACTVTCEWHLGDPSPAVGDWICQLEDCQCASLAVVRFADFIVLHHLLCSGQSGDTAYETD